MASGNMARDEKQIPHSALYTAATWKWGELPCAEVTMPEGADKLFAVVNAYMKFYRLINPAKYSLHHTLLHRHTMINQLLQSAACPQLIEIAAGFSPRGAHVSADPAVEYYEVDLEEVVALKRDQLHRTEAGKQVLQRSNFHQMVCDILKLDFLQAFPQERSFIITEGLMMYFDRREQMAIWRAMAAFIKANGGEYVFDYIPLDIEPRRSWLGNLLHTVKEWCGGDGQGYCYDERSRWDIRDDLLEAGFSTVDVLESLEIVPAWGLPHSDTPTHVVVYHCR